MTESAAVISTALQEFFNSNIHDPKLLCQSTRTLIKLISNAGQKNDDKFRKIRFYNPKVQELVVRPVGTLDVLGLAGFHVEQDDDGGWNKNNRERFIVFSATSENVELGKQIVHQLEARLPELEFQYPAAGGGKAPTTKGRSPPSVAPPADAGPFLSPEDRRKRQEEAKRKKREREAAKKVALARWQEDKEHREQIEARKTAAKQLAIVRGEGEFATRDEISIRRMEAVTAPPVAASLGPNKPALHPLALATAVRGGEKKHQPEHPPKGEAGSDWDPPPAKSDAMPLASNLKSPPPAKSAASAVPPSESEEKHPSKDPSKRENGTIGDAAMPLASNLKSPPVAAPAVDLASPAPPAPPDSPAVETDRMDVEDDSVAAAMTDRATVGAMDVDEGRRAEEQARERQWKTYLENIPRCAAAENIRETSVFFRQHQQQGAPSFTAGGSPSCLRKLLRELDSMKESLPSDSRCGIWVRFDEETPQYIRAVIAAALPGPTPYNGGLFCFDMYVPDQYPSVPPSVKLLTTGSGTVRFGPNLYACGKVCLSLLGTWPGDPGERWNPNLSNLDQVLLSIQGLLLGCEHPYFLEPGHGGWEGTVKDGDFSMKGQTLSGRVVQTEARLPVEAAAYEDKLRNGTILYAMIDMIKATKTKGNSEPGKGLHNYRYLLPFAKPILAHFYHNRSSIRRSVRPWLDGRSFSTVDSKHALQELAQLYARLEKELDALQGPNADGIFEQQELTQQQQQQQQRRRPSALPAPADPPSVGAPVVVVDTLAAKLSPHEKEQGKQAKAPKLEENFMDMDEDKKSAAAAATATATATDNSNTDNPNDPTARLRQMMNEAAGRGDYVMAGKLQSEVKAVADLHASMKKAASETNFIRAGKLQEQLKARLVAALEDLPGEERKKHARMRDLMVSGAPDMGHIMGEEEFDDVDDDEDMGGEMTPQGMASPGIPSGAMNAAMHQQQQQQQQFPPYVFPPPGYKNQAVSSSHPWGGGRTLRSEPTTTATEIAETETAATCAAVAAAAAPSETAATPKKPRSGIPCRLRLRLPGADKSVTEEFDAADTLANVYRGIEQHLQSEQGNAGGSSSNVAAMARRTQVMTPYGAHMAEPTAFANPLSLKGFTLLLAHPKREFSLEMHGTKTLQDLGLVPTASLTVMMCAERGLVRRGDLESRLNQAQGDAMDVEGLSYEGMLELTERVGATERVWTAQDQEKLERNSILISPTDYLAKLMEEGEDSRSISSQDQRCPICLGNFDENDTEPSLRRLRDCPHVFHVACLSTWLRTKDCCPICKKSFSP